MVVLCASCQKFAEGRQTFRELMALRDQIATEFKEEVSDVSIADGDRLTVKFVNSPLSAGTREEKQQRADAVAAYVARQYKHPISSVRVHFVRRTGGSSASASEIYIGKR